MIQEIMQTARPVAAKAYISNDCWSSRFHLKWCLWITFDDGTSKFWCFDKPQYINESRAREAVEETITDYQKMGLPESKVDIDVKSLPPGWDRECKCCWCYRHHHRSINLKSLGQKHVDLCRFFQSSSC